MPHVVFPWVSDLINKKSRSRLSSSCARRPYAPTRAPSAPTSSSRASSRSRCLQRPGCALKTRERASTHRRRQGRASQAPRSHRDLATRPVLRGHTPPLLRCLICNQRKWPGLWSYGGARRTCTCAPVHVQSADLWDARWTPLARSRSDILIYYKLGSYRSSVCVVTSPQSSRRSGPARSFLS